LNASLFRELVQEELPQHDTTVFNPHDFDRHRYDYDVWTAYRDELDGLGYTMIEFDWLVVDGLSMTLEVCFDHQMRTALQSWTGDMVTGRRTRIPSSSDDAGLTYVPIPRYQAQISLVSSAGMTITPDSLALTDAGIAFLQDGLTNQTNRMYWSQEGCELGLQFEGGTEAARRKAFLSATDVFFEHSAVTEFKRYDLFERSKWREAIEGVFSSALYPPQLTVFETQEIAPVVAGK
jgi:hypothetical protein